MSLDLLTALIISIFCLEQILIIEKTLNGLPLIVIMFCLEQTLTIKILGMALHLLTAFIIITFCLDQTLNIENNWNGLTIECIIMIGFCLGITVLGDTPYLNSCQTTNVQTK